MVMVRWFLLHLRRRAKLMIVCDIDVLTPKKDQLKDVVPFV